MKYVKFSPTLSKKNTNAKERRYLRKETDRKQNSKREQPYKKIEQFWLWKSNCRRRKLSKCLYFESENESREKMKVKIEHVREMLACSDRLTYLIGIGRHKLAVVHSS